MKAALTPDLAVAKKFLELLGGDENDEFTFQTFDDDPDRTNSSLARVLHGTLDRHFDDLVRLQRRRAGAFVMVNEGDGLGRKAVNVIRVRMLFVDLDGAPLEPVLAWATPPHIVVESSPAKWHCYWRVSDCKLEGFKDAQRRLAVKFGGDKKVVDLPRVLRLPGFFHQKAEPFMSNLVFPK